MKPPRTRYEVRLAMDGHIQGIMGWNPEHCELRKVGSREWKLEVGLPGGTRLVVHLTSSGTIQAKAGLEGKDIT